MAEKPYTFDGSIIPEQAPLAFNPFAQNAQKVLANLTGQQKLAQGGGIFSPTMILGSDMSSQENQDQINIFGTLAQQAYQAGPLEPATNSQQKAKSTANVMKESLSAVQNLMNQGRAIPEGLAQQGLDIQSYGSIERDSAGNIIGLAPKLKYGPGGSAIGTVGGLKEWKAQEGGAGTPLTPRIDAMKQRQIESQKAEEAARSTPAAKQAEANRQAIIQSKISTIPQSATVEEIQTPQGTQRTTVGPSGYAQALIPKKKEGEV